MGFDFFGAIRRLMLREKMGASRSSGGSSESEALRAYEAMIANGKSRVDATFNDPDVAKLYMAQSIPYLLDVVGEKRKQFDAMWAVYRNPATHLRDPVRLVQFMNLMDIANAAPAGDYLEIGVHRGESARVMYTLMDKTRELFLLDTYEGFVAQDLEAEKQVVPGHTWTVGNFLDTSPEFVARYVGDGTPPANVHTVKGWFPESFKGLEDRSWRFIHLDMDLYEPTRAGLEILWPRVVPGGVMVFHDYENLSFPGVKKAVDDYFDRHGLHILHVGDLWGSAMIVKPKAPRT
jgi:O-methyltransferase